MGHWHTMSRHHVVWPEILWRTPTCNYVWLCSCLSMGKLFDRFVYPFLISPLAEAHWDWSIYVEVDRGCALAMERCGMLGDISLLFSPSLLTVCTTTNNWVVPPLSRCLLSVDNAGKVFTVEIRTSAFSRNWLKKRLPSHLPTLRQRQGKGSHSPECISPAGGPWFAVGFPQTRHVPNSDAVHVQAVFFFPWSLWWLSTHLGRTASWWVRVVFLARSIADH